MNNYEWLLAMSGEERQAWFDAPRDAGEASMMSVDAFIAEHSAHSKEQAPSVTTFSDDTQNFTDTRTLIVADVNAWIESNVGFSIWASDLQKQIIGWLDRQAAITRAECDKPNWEYCETCELTAQVDNLAHDLRESERLREEMREELSIAYDHAHDLLARRDRGLA